MSEPSFQDIRDLKQKLEIDITRLIDKFNEDAGVSPSRIYIDLVNVSNVGRKAKKIVNTVEMEIEI